ncbi:diguanylate cyclase/phosphodiesterase (GGDEF & EAL domains) with PAS/PAC sensor(s) [hydrothermal vent metagenome]|uniref:Diguanylate cyclase/phosphodiesterase (GGDEF & EAL domains) with PAS/PAC sensor(S) n=1 Tax=hydrothermal vent metagenome TaxID=652676 RepID=A0A3B0ZFH9_9ZZZZ
MVDTQSSDHRLHEERRRQEDRRNRAEPSASGCRYPTWNEQRIQFFTRYAFMLLGILFFNFVEGITPAYWTLTWINAAFAVYFLINTALLLSAYRRPIYLRRFYVAMWLDILMVSIAVLNDPYMIPPSLLVYIMVALGNGMRYGMKLFATSLIGCFTATIIVLLARYQINGLTVSPGLLFLNLFGGSILIYAYILMGCIEGSRRQLEQNSRLDMLTGMLNRRALVDTAEMMFRRLQRNQPGFILLFADLDKFKAVNDELGHATGDRVLKQFADIVRHSIRSTDVAARFGGDEFVMLLDDTSLEEAGLVAGRIQSQVEQWASANKIDFSATFGLGEAPTHGEDFASLLEQVDKALYCSKTEHTGGGLAYAKNP